MPAQPIATSHCPWRHARPKLSVISTATVAPVSSRRRARSPRAEASGSRGSTTSMPVSPCSGGVGGVDAGVGAHEAVVRAADEHAALGAQDLGGLVEHDLDGARVLALRLRPARGRAGRARCSSSATTAPSALETTLCATATIWPSVSARGLPPSPSAATISSPRSSPGRTSGRPRKAVALSWWWLTWPVTPGARSAGLGEGGERPCVPSRPSTARVRGAPVRAAGQQLAAARRGPRPCRCRAAATPGARSGRPRRPRAPSARWRSQLSGPKLGRDRVRGCEQQAVGAGPVTVGHDRPRLARLDACAGVREQRSRAPPGRARGSRRGRTARARIPRREPARHPGRPRRSGSPRRCPATTSAPR